MKGLRVDVFVIFGEVKTAPQTLINSTTIVLSRQTQFGFDRAAQEGRPYLLSLSNLDTVRRTLESLEIARMRSRKLKPKHVPHNRG